MPDRLIGRTADFGSVSLGSSPSRATKCQSPATCRGFFLCFFWCDFRNSSGAGTYKKVDFLNLNFALNWLIQKINKYVNDSQIGYLHRLNELCTP